jgi:hypothetical protein
MTTDGVLSAEPAGEGFRWKYITVGGAEHLGAKIWKTKASAVKDGRNWLTQR